MMIISIDRKNNKHKNHEVKASWYCEVNGQYVWERSEEGEVGDEDRNSGARFFRALSASVSQLLLHIGSMYWENSKNTNG
jgi:hypothetical protein